jgi:hypothetical protein
MQKSKSSFDPVILGVMRKAWPQLIAQAIIGVQPMSGPTGRIFNLFSRYRITKFKMSKERFKWFLRLNDRKQQHHPEEFIKAKYPLITLTKEQIDRRAEIWDWCDDNIGKHRWCHNDYDLIAFCDEKYVMLFQMVWG